MLQHNRKGRKSIHPAEWFSDKTEEKKKWLSTKNSHPMPRPNICRPTGYMPPTSHTWPMPPTPDAEFIKSHSPLLDVQQTPMHVQQTPSYFTEPSHISSCVLDIDYIYWLNSLCRPDFLKLKNQWNAFYNRQENRSKKQVLMDEKIINQLKLIGEENGVFKEGDVVGFLIKEREFLQKNMKKNLGIQIKNLEQDKEILTLKLNKLESNFDFFKSDLNRFISDIRKEYIREVLDLKFRLNELQGQLECFNQDVERKKLEVMFNDKLDRLNLVL